MVIKNLHPLKRSYAWLKGPQELKYKLAYYPHLLVSYFYFYVFNKRRINYLGEVLHFDARVAPLALMMYPKEINAVVSCIDGKIRNVLDIGGNIGQFSITFANLVPGASIDSFEPHPNSYELLEKNVAHLKKVRIYKYGVGPKGEFSLHFIKGRSVNASLVKDNSNYRMPSQKVEKVKVEIVENVPKYTGKTTYDLIKIDVEGYEYGTLGVLHNLKTRYLYLEITGTKERKKEYIHSDLFALIEKNLGKFDIRYVTAAAGTKFEILLEFK